MAIDDNNPPNPNSDYNKFSPENQMKPKKMTQEQQFIYYMKLMDANNLKEQKDIDFKYSKELKEIEAKNAKELSDNEAEKAKDLKEIEAKYAKEMEDMKSRSALRRSFVSLLGVALFSASFFLSFHDLNSTFSSLAKSIGEISKLLPAFKSYSKKAVSLILLVIAVIIVKGKWWLPKPAF
jgi:hypothetical protein